MTTLDPIGSQMQNPKKHGKNAVAFGATIFLSCFVISAIQLRSLSGPDSLRATPGINYAFHGLYKVWSWSSLYSCPQTLQTLHVRFLRNKIFCRLKNLSMNLLYRPSMVVYLHWRAFLFLYFRSRPHLLSPPCQLFWRMSTKLRFRIYHEHCQILILFILWLVMEVMLFSETEDKRHQHYCVTLTVSQSMHLEICTSLITMLGAVVFAWWRRALVSLRLWLVMVRMVTVEMEDQQHQLLSIIPLVSH